MVSFSPGDVPRTQVMGVVNVTPDSFSDGGLWLDEDAAVAHGLELLAAGADILDVGGESTRPGSQRPEQDEELRRVVPVIRRLAEHGAVVSVDTMRAEVAQAALDVGAQIVNDVSGGLADPDMCDVVARSGAPYILMHWRAHGAVMQQLATYDDVVREVRAELGSRVEAALAAGIGRDRLVVDPGLGFSKTADHNWTLLAHLNDLDDLGLPMVVGASRKAFLGMLMADAQGRPAPPLERDAATGAISVVAAQAGAWAVRVHDVAASVAAIRVVERMRAADLVRREGAGSAAREDQR
ncbi:Dihydropteroate synthase [Austwickia sp. TVS 96-490-7B]|uniref:dihydropteroate synthase n=1 Tax=Austwickia sp. TVS 96-490-7B TaxID=2830843 RepID=UPI001DB40701|nr:dihydropteroate synthase [Austwickia sp. TVS 96-490-7B]MBW3084831.1 Dihydropteroate synthase [Austwickia sp. TVS 96-490-7B]